MNAEHTGKMTYTITEVAKITGLSRSYLYRLSAEGRLPLCKIGTRCLIFPDDLEKFLRSKARPVGTKGKER